MELSRRAERIKPSSTLAISAKASELKSQGFDIVGFGVGEPDFETQNILRKLVLRLLKMVLQDIHQLQVLQNLEKLLLKNLKMIMVLTMILHRLLLVMVQNMLL